MKFPEVQFTESELTVMADIVVGRYDALNDILNEFPAISNKAQLTLDLRALQPAVEKLRPYYTGAG